MNPQARRPHTTETLKRLSRPTPSHHRNSKRPSPNKVQRAFSPYNPPGCPSAGELGTNWPGASCTRTLHSHPSGKACCVGLVQAALSLPAAETGPNWRSSVAEIGGRLARCWVRSRPTSIQGMLPATDIGATWPCRVRTHPAPRPGGLSVAEIGANWPGVGRAHGLWNHLASPLALPPLLLHMHVPMSLCKQERHVA